MQNKFVRRPSDHLRPRLTLARRLICLVSGRPVEADALIANVLTRMTTLHDITEANAITLCFFSLVVSGLEEKGFRSDPIKLIGALPLTSEGAAVALLTLEFSNRLAYTLECILNFTEGEAAFIASVAPTEHQRRVMIARQRLEEMF